MLAELTTLLHLPCPLQHLERSCCLYWPCLLYSVALPKADWMVATPLCSLHGLVPASAHALSVWSTDLDLVWAEVTHRLVSNRMSTLAPGEAKCGYAGALKVHTSL